MSLSFMVQACFKRVSTAPGIAHLPFPDHPWDERDWNVGIVTTPHDILILAYYSIHSYK